MRGELDTPIVISPLPREARDKRDQAGKLEESNGVVRTRGPRGLGEDDPVRVLLLELVDVGPLIAALLVEARLEALAIEDANAVLVRVEPLATPRLIVPPKPGAIGWIIVMIDLAYRKM